MPSFNRWDIRDILYLAHQSKFSNTHIKTIIDSFNNLQSFLNSNSKYLYFLDGKIYQDSNGITLRIEKILENCEKNSIKIISLWDETYPSLLKHIHYPPLFLYIKGEIQNQLQKSISIVGTRKATSYGRLVTEKYVDYFVNNGIKIISGMAQGIDSYAHHYAIKANGTTYAIIASGIDCISPSYALKTSRQIIDSGGAIISEYPLGTTAKPGYFPQRNRIISGIADATLIVESGLKSGSLITAKFAFDQQRPLFAIPGNINSEKSIGTNALIRDNYAILASSPDIVLKELNWEDRYQLASDKQTKIEFDDPIEEKIYQFINSEPQQVDNISVELNLTISDLLIKLLNLEFKGLIKQLPGKHYIRSL